MSLYMSDTIIKRRPIYWLSAERIDTLSICTSFFWKVCITCYGGRRRLVFSNQLLIVFHLRKKIKKITAFLHILKAGNKPGHRH